MHRRTLLTSGVAILAGCLSGDPPGSTPTRTSPGSEPSPSGPIPGDRIDFRVGSRQCGEGKNAAQVDFRPDAVAIAGTIGGRDTCETATLDVARRDGDRLVVRVVTTMAESGTPACAQCLTDIEYTCTIETGPEWPAQVTVIHGRGSDATTVADVSR